MKPWRFASSGFVRSSLARKDHTENITWSSSVCSTDCTIDCTDFLMDCILAVVKSLKLRLYSQYSTDCPTQFAF